MEQWTADRLLGGGCRRCCRDNLHAVQGLAGRRAGAVDRAAGEAHARFPARSPREPIAITASSPTALARCCCLRPTIAATPRLRTRSGTSNTVSASITCPQAASCQRRLAGGPGESPITSLAGRRGSASVRASSPPARCGGGSSLCPGELTRSARRLTLHLPERWPWAGAFTDALTRLRAIPLPT